MVAVVVSVGVCRAGGVSVVVAVLVVLLVIVVDVTVVMWVCKLLVYIVVDAVVEAVDGTGSADGGGHSGCGGCGRWADRTACEACTSNATNNALLKHAGCPTDMAPKYNYSISLCLPCAFFLVHGSSDCPTRIPSSGPSSHAHSTPACR